MTTPNSVFQIIKDDQVIWLGEDEERGNRVAKVLKGVITQVEPTKAAYQAAALSHREWCRAKNHRPQTQRMTGILLIWADQLN